MKKAAYNLAEYVWWTRGVELTELDLDERLELREELEQLEQQTQMQIDSVINLWKRKEQGCSI